MDQPLTRNDLKVDATTLKDEDSSLVLFNINVPLRIVQGNPNEFYNTCVQIGQFISDNFHANDSIYFQVTASYYIINKQTGEGRLWGGSFSPRANSVAQLLPFQQYINNTFPAVVVRASSNAEEKLVWIGRDTNWEFDRLESIVINVQSQIDNDHETLQRHNLDSQKHVTFKLP